MTCWCDAAYSTPSDCPRCRGTFGGIIPPPVDLSLPAIGLGAELPDGPDELLSELAEMEATIAHERRALDEDGSARRCRYCRGLIPAGPGAGVHEACLPRELPDGARSCAGCAELILDDDDDFEHDFCLTFEGDDDAGAVFRFVHGESLLSEGFDFEPQEDTDYVLVPMTTDDDAPTEPVSLPAALDGAPLQHSDEFCCPCGRWLPYSLTAPLDAVERNLLTATTLDCSCSVRVTLTYSWVRGCIVGLRLERRSFTIN